MNDELFLPQYCRDVITDFLHMGWWLLAAGFAFGVLYVVLDLIAKLKANNAVKKIGAEDGGALDAMKGVIEALIRAPAWFSLFLGGLALIWISSSELPKICRPNDEVRRERTGDRADKQGRDQAERSGRADSESGGR